MHVYSEMHLLFFSAELLKESFLFYQLCKPKNNVFSALLGPLSQKGVLGEKQGRVQQEKPPWRSEM